MMAHHCTCCLIDELLFSEEEASRSSRRLAKFPKRDVGRAGGGEEGLEGGDDCTGGGGGGGGGEKGGGGVAGGAELPMSASPPKRLAEFGALEELRGADENDTGANCGRSCSINTSWEDQVENAGRWPEMNKMLQGCPFETQRKKQRGE